MRDMLESAFFRVLLFFTACASSELLLRASQIFHRQPAIYFLAQRKGLRTEPTLFQPPYGWLTPRCTQ